MNPKTFALALALSAGLTSLAHAAPVTTLDTVQVRPSADQTAQAQWEAASDIPTLAAVQVRPGPELTATAPTIVTLAAVQVRPDAELHAALAAEAAADQQQYLVSIAGLAAQLRQLALATPVLQLGSQVSRATFNAAAQVVLP